MSTFRIKIVDTGGRSSKLLSCSSREWNNVAMMANPVTFTGTVLSDGVPRRLRAKGVVEARIDSKTYVVSVGNEELRVKLEDGELRPGDRVQVSRKGETVILRKLPRESRKDIIQLARIPTGSPESVREMQKLTAVLRHIAALESAPPAPEQFKELESALLQLSRSTEGALSDAAREAGELLRAFVADGDSANWPITREAFLRLSALIQNYRHVEFLTNIPMGTNLHVSELLPALEGLPKEVADVLKTMSLRNSPTTPILLNLVNILKHAHIASLDRLKELFSAVPKELADLGNSGPVGNLRLSQWFSTAVSTDTSLSDLLERFPQPGDSAPDLAQYIVSASTENDLATNNVFASTTLENNLPTEVPRSFIPDTITALGLDTEHQFSAITPRSTIPDNLKTRLLQALFERTAAPDGKSVSASPGPKTEPVLSASLLRIFSHWNTLHGNLIEALEPTRAAGLPAMPEAPDTREGMSHGLFSAFARIDRELKNAFEMLMSNRISPTQAGQAAERLINELLENFARLRAAETENCSSSSRHINATDDDKSGTAAVEVLSDLEAKIRSLHEEFSTFTESRGSASNGQSVVQNLETALSRLESLQLLARPTSTAEGTQQVITIPIQADGEWKDITIKLLRRNDKEKEKKPGTYSVQVHIAPGFLGSVSAHLEYEQNRELVVNIACERDCARDWLSARKEVIAEGLRTLGFKSVRTAVSLIEVCSPNPSKPTDTPFNPDAASGIDLRI